MKTKNLLAPSLAACLVFALSSCGGSDSDDAGGSNGQTSEQGKAATPRKEIPEVEASDIAKQAARDRIETMKKITAVLKPLRDPEAALAKEEELKALFTEYNEHTKTATAEGIEGRQLALLTTQVAPGAWADTRAEFQQYMLLVRQLGQAQRDMMDRLIQISAPAGANEIKKVDDHLQTISGSAENANGAAKATQIPPLPRPETQNTSPE